MATIREILKNLRTGDRITVRDRAERWQELGRLGLGPLWNIYPRFQSYDQNHSTPVLEALEEYAQDLWLEALWCYIDASFLACIATSSFALEATFKRVMESRNVDYGEGDGLGRCIAKCQDSHILPKDNDNMVIVAAKEVNRARNNIVHANIPRVRPESILYSEGTEHEVIVGDSGLTQTIEQFKNLARDTLVNTKKVLDFLCA
jgi:hypothetical protein